MGQRESSPRAPRRVDPRWARVALAQLRDEAFLDQQRRRQETIAGARQASGALRRHRRRRGVFVDAPTRGDHAVWTTLLLKDKKQQQEAEEEGEDEGEDARLNAVERAQLEDEREDELLNALVLLGDLPQPSRAAYLLCHLDDQLAKLCAVPDAVADVVALRRDILRDVYDAVALQHNQYKAAAMAFQATVDLFTRMKTQPVEAPKNKSVPTTASGKTSAEAALASSFVTEMLSGLLDVAPVELHAQKREILREIATLIDALAPQSLAIKKSNTLEGNPRQLVQQLQRFLLAIVRREDASSDAAFDLADRTLAMKCLIQLAGASASAGDLLLVVSVLLGIGEELSPVVGATTSPTQVPSPPKSVRSSYAPSPPRVKSEKSPKREHIHLKEYDADIVAEDERVDLLDEAANVAVEQRLKQVHKQRADLGVKGELDGQTTAVDQLLSSHAKRKTGAKNPVVAHTKSAVSNITIINGSASNGHRVGPQAPPHISKLSLKVVKDDFNNVSLEADVNFSLDVTSSQSAIPSTRSPKHHASFPVTLHPKFHQLRVGSVLKEIDQLKPVVTLRQHLGKVVTDRPNVNGFHFASEGFEDDHEVWSCGQNSYGELGHGDSNSRKTFERVEALQQKDVVYISAGNEHTIVLSADGTVWTCGYNDNGQCGLGVTTRVNHLTELQKLGDAVVTQVHAYNGCEHSILVTQDGRAASCGYNYRGQLGHGSTQSESVPKIIRSIEGRFVRLVSCSYYHTAITCDHGPTGKSLVYTFGRNDYGQLGHSDTIDRKVPQCVETLHDQHVVSVACGQYHTMVVASSGKLYAFGKNDYGQLGIDAAENQLNPVHVKHGLERQNCLEVRCGYYHSMVLCAGAHLFGFGRNDYGQLGLGKASNSLATNMQLQQQRFAKPVILDDLEGKDIVRFACGCYHTVAVSDNGILYVFGRNNHGQLGTGDTHERFYPYPIDDFVGKRVALVAAGFYHTLVLTGGKDDDVDREQDISFHSNDPGSKVINCDNGEQAEIFAITCSSILATSCVRNLFEDRLCQTTKVSPHRMSGLANGIVLRDPTVDFEHDDGRTEDRKGSSSVDGIFSDLLETTGGIRKLNLSDDRDGIAPMSMGQITAMSDSIEVAIIIVALLDRLSQPFLAKRGVYFPPAHQVGTSEIEAWLNSDASLIDVVEGLFEPCSIDASAATLSTLSQLITQLLYRRFDAFAASQVGMEVTSNSVMLQKPLTITGQLQVYLLGACTRILRANILQLVRSGASSVLLAAQNSCGANNGDLTRFNSLSDMIVAIQRVRSVLLEIISKSVGCDGLLHGSHGLEVNTPLTLAEAVDTLVAGVEIFFPCQCLRVKLLVSLLTCESQIATVVCEMCRSFDWTKFSVQVAPVKRRLLLMLLNQFSSDVFVVKLLPIFSSEVCSSVSSCIPGFEALRCLVEAVLHRLHCHFLESLGQISPSDGAEEAGTPSKSSVDDSLIAALVGLLDAMLKHLASDVSYCKRWTMHISLDPSMKLPARLGAVVSQAFCVTRMGPDEDKTDSFPREWRCYAEIAKRILSHSNDVMLQVLSRGLASPTRRSYGEYSVSNTSPKAGFRRRISRILERSIIHTLLPVLLDSIETFAHIPAFAACFIHPLSSLLDLLDKWNSSNPDIKHFADLDFSCTLKSTTTSLAGLTTKKQSGLESKFSSAATTLDGSSKTTNALSLPWSLLLEKELALVCASIVVTITTGDPLVSLVDADIDSRTVPSPQLRYDKWHVSPLFKGGLSTDFIHNSLVVESTLSRSIPYTPPLRGFEQDGFMPTFRVEIPGQSTQDEDSKCGFGVTTNPYSCLRSSVVRRFIAQMARTKGIDDPEIQPIVQQFCQWIRELHALRDPAYRMLVRQSSTYSKFQVEIASPHVFNDSELEEIYFAAVLHHHALSSFALLVAVGRFTSAAVASEPPKSLTESWRIVAGFRKRIVAERTAIKNAQDIVYSQVHILEFQREVINRLHLLLFLNVDGEDEHKLRLLDGGFVAPSDPAYMLRYCFKTERSIDPAQSLRSHMSSSYGADGIPFLAAFPSSRWRRVRTLFHVVARWRSAVRSIVNIHIAPLASALIEFVMADKSDIGDVIVFAHEVLVEPCRRLAFSTRGFELASELLRTPRLECVRTCFLRQLAQASNPRASPAGSHERANIQLACASFAYHELQRNAQNDFLALLAQIMADKVASSPENAPRHSIESVLLVLLRCLSLTHFTDDQYAFINDSGLVQALLQLWLGEDDYVGIQPNGSLNDNIRAIEALSSREKRAAQPADSFSRTFSQAVWALVRGVVLHFGSSSSVGSDKAKPCVPVYPAGFDIFEALGGTGSQLLQLANKAFLRQPSDVLKHAGSSVNATIRRSFEIIGAPHRFSFLTKGLTFGYKDMTEPASGLLAMSPLVKPSELSITTWIYASPPHQTQQLDQQESNPSLLEERQIVFVRGSEREISPYLLLSRDMDSKWQLEVGVAVHITQVTALTSTRLLWEKITSKESVPPRKWTHVAIIMEGAKLRLYINGVLDSQRSLSGPLAIAMNNGRVDHDFCFGRKPPIEIPTSDQECSSEQYRAPIAMEFLSALLSASSITSKSLMALNPTDTPTTVRSFHGLLSHFRFHNRSLSPIHVRIVFDEKKPAKEDDLNSKIAVKRSPQAVTQILQLHAMLRVMVESDEGRVHLADVSWTLQLMEVVLTCREHVPVISSLHLLREILILQSPKLVNNSFREARGILNHEYGFVGHMLFIVGVCISPSTLESVELPIPAIVRRFRPTSAEPGCAIELRNSTAERMLEEDHCGLDAICLANELTTMMLKLVQHTQSDFWRHEILSVVASVLCDDVVNDRKGSLTWFLRLGTLYVLGGVSGALITGEEVKIAGNQDRATIVTVDDGVFANSRQGGRRPRGTQTATFCVSVHGGLEERDMQPSWQDQVITYCASLRRQLLRDQNASHFHRFTNNEAGNDQHEPFIRVHCDDVERAPSPYAVLFPTNDAQDTLTADTAKKMANLLLDFDVDYSCGAVHGIGQLCRWLESGLLVRSFVHITSCELSGSVLLQNRDLFAKLLELSTRDDGNPVFRTLDDAERRLWIVRARVYQVLRDLEDQGEVEVEHWIRLKLSKRESDAKVAQRFQQESSLEFGAEMDTQRERVVVNPDAKLDLRLDLEIDNPSVDVEIASPRGSENSSDGVVDRIVKDRSRTQAEVGEGDSEGDGSDAGDGNDDDDEADDDEDEDGDDDDDDEEAIEHRQEFVDELMMMGFPEEWCVLALKQTENDIVSASAWIVDNLEYLSRLQTSLDKQRDQSATDVAVQDEDDDYDEPTAGDNIIDETSSPPKRQDLDECRLTPKPVCSDSTIGQLINDKETGRKIFGEMYFPLDEGGFLSNTTDHFLFPWRSEKTSTYASSASPPSTSPQDVGEEGLSAPLLSDTQRPADSLDQFNARVMTLELHELLDLLAEFEQVVLVLSSRQIVINLLMNHDRYSEDIIELMMSPSFLKFVKLVLFRGNQFSRKVRGTTQVDEALWRCLDQIMKRCKIDFGTRLLDFAIAEIEVAGSTPAYEAYLWTHRELARPDRTVLSEPAVELAFWLIDLVIKCDQDVSILSVDGARSLISRLRLILRSANLPVKFVALTSLSRILQRLRQCEEPTHLRSVEAILTECRLDVKGFLHAARSRFIRERVQHRTIFSLYLQAYVEILFLLKSLSPVDSELGIRAIPAPIATSCLIDSNPPPDPSNLYVNRPRLQFDPKKCRSNLLQISDDGLTAMYSGNEMWKTVVATQSFATGAHEWHIRVDKSPSSYLFIGVATRKSNPDSFLGADEQSWGFIGDKGLYYQRNRLRVYGDSFGEGDVVGVHLNCEIGSLSFSKNGLALGVAFENVFDEVFPAVAFYSRHQKVTIVQPEIEIDVSADRTAFGTVESEGTVEEAVLVCEIMAFLTGKSSLPPEVFQSAHKMTMGWWNDTGRYVVTRVGGSLWVNTTKEAFEGFNFLAEDRVRSPRGNGRVLGIADGRLWIEIDGESGAWHIHPSRLRTVDLSISKSNDRQDDSYEHLHSTGYRETRRPTQRNRLQTNALDQLTETEFRVFVQDQWWSAALDRAMLGFINSHCEVTSTSPWNVTPSDVLRVVRDNKHDIEVLTGVTFDFDDEVRARRLERKILVRFGFLRYFNAYLRRVIGFFDSTWLYFSSKSGLVPSTLLSKCRGSIFTSIKNDFFTALMDKTSNSPKKSDDDYDYPEDLTQMLINRPKAATAKCHPGTTKSILLSMFGQAFEELHFLPLRALRMVYSHPMDDGQLRSFKVKFEGEGVDDYGGPYREFFSQFFAELQMLSGEGEAQLRQTYDDKDTKLGASFLPFFLPSPNWRNGVGSNREKFVLNGALLGSSRVGSARVLEEHASRKHSRRRGWSENPEVKRQLLSEMCHFLGQMIGIALRTRVCVRLDLAMSVWKQLVGEQDILNDPSGRDRVLQSLKEIDHASHALIKTLSSLHERHSQTTDPLKRFELEEEMSALDLSFTTYLSDGRLVELCNNGSEVPVTMENVSQYVNQVLEARSCESQEVVNVIKQGIHSVIPVAALSLLTWEELEKRICGVAEVDVELLKANTEYDEDLSANDEFIQRFWRVLSAMEDEDKRAFLRFVWARSRLPVGTAQFHQKFKIQSLAPAGSSETNIGTSTSNTSGYADGQLPKSHTCFFALQLPRYSSDDVCRKQLLYAIHNCVEMDGDFRLADTEMTGWTEINPNDQLRF